MRLPRHQVGYLCLVSIRDSVWCQFWLLKGRLRVVRLWINKKESGRARARSWNSPTRLRHSTEFERDVLSTKCFTKYLWANLYQPEIFQFLKTNFSLNILYTQEYVIAWLSIDARDERRSQIYFASRFYAYYSLPEFTHDNSNPRELEPHANSK